MQDVASLNTFFQSNFGTIPDEKQLSVSGKNWGEVDLNGISMSYESDLPFTSANTHFCILGCLSSYICLLVAFGTPVG